MITYLPYCHKTCLLQFPRILKRQKMYSVGHIPMYFTSLESPGCAFHSTLGLNYTACMVFEIKALLLFSPQRISGGDTRHKMHPIHKTVTLCWRKKRPLTDIYVNVWRNTFSVFLLNINSQSLNWQESYFSVFIIIQLSLDT